MTAKAKQREIDFKAMTIRQIVGIVNATDPGATDPRAVTFLRDRFGVRVESGPNTIDFLKLSRELFGYWSDVVTRPKYDRAKTEAEVQRRRRRIQNDIGELPAVQDKALRRRCDRSLAVFLRRMFPDKFYLPMSPAHRQLIEEIEYRVEHGGRKAFACERGFGKTQIAIGAVMWGTLTGRVQYALLIGANSEQATKQRDGIARRLATSDELLAIYPEIAGVFRKMAGTKKPAATYRGEPIGMKYRPDLVFPRIDGAPGSEAVIGCTGIDSGSIRGRYHDRADGHTARPSFVMLDDPQDDEMAKNANEVRKRSEKIRQAVHGLAGPGEKLAILMPCTIIRRGDLADEFTDRAIRRDYEGVRVKAMPEMPADIETDEPLWTQYDELRREDLANGDILRRRATKFYVDNMRAMKRGAVVTWPQRVDADCVDAIQNLMDKYFEDRLSFMAEQQQEPQGEDELSQYLDERGIASRYNELPRRALVPDAVMITTGIDVQEHLLYWSQIAWKQDLTGYVVDWGTFPRQPVADFHHMKPPRTIRQWLKQTRPLQGYTWEQGMTEAILELWATLPRYNVENGPALIDWRWHKSRGPVGVACSREDTKGILIPAGGLSVSGNDTPISERRMPPGSARMGKDVEWYLKNSRGEPRAVYFDANFYRSQFQKGLAQLPGSPGSITYNARAPDPVLASHYGAKAVRLSVDTKRQIEIWQNKPGRDQDHQLDTAVMARVAAEVAGMRTSGERFVLQRPQPITQDTLPKGRAT
jgi:hypothetical protein